MFKNKHILIVGGTGTIGCALTKRILKDHPEVIRIYSRDEYKQFIMKEELNDATNLRFLIGDVRDKERLNRAMQDIDVVFNLAALKHVPSCEYNPFEAVKTNILGAQNVIESAMENGVRKLIYTSSDKAVSPTNTMGATKLLAERIISSSYYARGYSGTIFASVRFGNVIGSRGSVIPLFKKQIIENRYITVTEPEMTRFMMSSQEAIDLVLKAARIAKGGEVFVLKMPVIKLIDLAEVVIEKVCKKEGIKRDSVEIKTIGLRNGEKNYEELLSEDEALKSLELEDMYIIKPFYNGYEELSAKKLEGNEYSSKDCRILTKDEISQMLDNEGLI